MLGVLRRQNSGYEGRLSEEMHWIQASKVHYWTFSANEMSVNSLQVTETFHQ